MRIDDCFQLGYISKTHGLQGEVHAVLDVDFPEAYEEMESVFLQLQGSGTLIPFFIENFRLQKDSVIVKFEEIDSIEQAEELLKAQLYLPLDQLPQLDEGQFYFHEIIGFRIEDELLGTLGSVKDVYEAGPQTLLAMDYQQQEVLIPLTDEIVTKVDKAQQTVYTRLPEGLLDIYLS
ncbi:MAG: ribosome maturation factor RimM [Cyclobacteriaceae bacterium]